MLRTLQRFFPALRTEDFEVTIPASEGYNCIAWAAGEQHRIWWPFPDPFAAYWPKNAPREETVEAFVAAFATIGYVLCDNAEVESGFEKLAIYVIADRLPKHIARQLKAGTWTSKLGPQVDIEHKTLQCIEGAEYGEARIFLKRPRTE